MVEQLVCDRLGRSFRRPRTCGSHDRPFGIINVYGVTLGLAFILVIAIGVPSGSALPTDGAKRDRLEKEELAFAKNSLLREIGSVGAGGGAAEENAIRRAHRKIALRYRQNLLGTDAEKFEFQMRILNLARESLIRGEQTSGPGSGEDGAEDDERDSSTTGRELPSGSRMSEDILKQIQSWQEYALEEGIRFDSPDVPYFVGHTLHSFRRDFESNWTHFVRTELVEMWPAAAQLRLHLEIQGGESVTDVGGLGREHARRMREAVQRLSRDALSTIAGVLYSCGAGRGAGGLHGVLPDGQDTAAWVTLQIRASQALRSMTSGGGGGGSSAAAAAAAAASASLGGPGRSLVSSGGSKGVEHGGAAPDEEPAPPPLACAAIADRDARLALLELNLQALVQLEATLQLGNSRQDLSTEIRAAHAVVAATRAEATPLHCREVASQRRGALDKLWEDYQFGPLIAEAYPLDACSLDGLASFLEFHCGPGGVLLERKGEPDRSVLRAVRGLLWLQRAVARPASLDVGQWRDAIDDLQHAVWQGVAFPELHEAAGKVLAEVAGAGLMPSVLEVALEHPPVRAGPEGATSTHGREPGDVQPARGRKFAGLDVPGYSLRPIERYEELAINMWGDEDKEENWDPVRLGLAMIDLVPACELPIQIAVCFLSAALWFWRALQLLGDKCGGDGWLETYINEELWSVPPDAKRLAMQFGLKRAIFELLEYSTQFAEYNLQPGARLAVHRAAYLLLWKVTQTFGDSEDVTRVLTQLRRMLASARLNPFWSPPVLQVADAVFADILGGRLHSAFLDGLRQKPFSNSAQDSDEYNENGLNEPPVPGAVLEHCVHEGAIMGLGDLVVDPTIARFEAMGALLKDVGRPSWTSVESLLAPAPLRLDLRGFTVGRRLVWPTPDVGDGTSRTETLSTGASLEFTAVRGVRVDFRSGRVSLLLSRPTGSSMPVLALDDLSDLLGLEDPSPLYLSLEAPTERGGIQQYPHHPFQRAVISPAGVGRRAEATMLHAAFGLQQIAAGNEVAMRVPFPFRPCNEGLCNDLPLVARSVVAPVTRVPGEAWDVPSRLVFECSRIPYSQNMEGETLEVIFGSPHLEVHTGKALRVLDEETFKTWPVSKLRQALQQVEVAGADNAELPALEKHELIDRLLRAVERGQLLEDEDETGNPLNRFARRFTHYLPSIVDRWPHFARVAPLCALRAVSLVLQSQLQQMNDSAEAQSKEARAGAEAHINSIQHQQNEYWRAMLANVHERLLSELGYVDLDPGGCFAEGGTRSFARCCSIGDHAAECWEDMHERIEPLIQTVGEARLRCCGPAARRGGMNMQLIASIAGQLGSMSPRRPSPEVLIPLVSSWLGDPNGAADDGTLHSVNLVNSLAEEIKQEDIIRNTDEQVRRPIEKLQTDIGALRPSNRGLLSTPASGGPESWLPVPPVAATGNRRVLYASVALTPQLQYSETELITVSGKAQLVEVPLDSLVKPVAHESPTPRDQSDTAALGVMHEAALLLSKLDEMADNIKRGAVPNEENADHADVPQEAEDIGDCSYDGWQDLPASAKQRRAMVNAGQRIRIRRRMGEDVNGEVGVMNAELTLTGAPNEAVIVWQVSPVSGGPVQYIDPSDSDLVVSVVCDSNTGNSPSSSPQQVVEAWPNCVEVGIAFPSTDGAGLFVNLQAFNVTRGCFLNDCSYSDHFGSASPADCARMCAQIGACQWWTFQEPAPPTCWLRGEGVRTREEAQGYSSGGTSCVPPAEVPEDRQARDPTLFELVGGASGVPPPQLWSEWDLLGVLEDFGNFTIKELQQTRPTPRRAAALRAAAIVSSSCAASWQGCS